MIDCLIFEDVVYTNKNCVNINNILGEYGRGSLAPNFFLFYRDQGILSQRSIIRNDCIIGDTKELKVSYPELFI